MDLFGDLPSVKNPRKLSSTDQTSSSCELLNENANSLTSSIVVAAADNVCSRVSKELSLVGTIGSVGTTRGFLPTALLRKSGATAATNGPVAGGASVQKVKVTKTSVAVRTDSVEWLGEATISNLTERQSEKNDVTSNNDNGAISGAEKRQQEDFSAEGQECSSETEELAMLHASVTDPYDPFIPNDYLEYCEEKRREVERRELEEATRETLRQQQIIREQIAEERRKMIETGDYQSVISSVINRHAQDTQISGPSMVPITGQNSDIKDKVESSSVSVSTTQNPKLKMGRGRGVHNLPAWLLQKTQEESVASGTLVGADEAVSDEVTASNRCVVFFNMTPPGAIDEELHDEVKEECEAQCGPVEGNIIVKDADAHHSQVRVIVLFKHAADAQKASKIFHGRSFGGRQITAALVDEEELSRL